MIYNSLKVLRQTLLHNQNIQNDKYEGMSLHIPSRRDIEKLTPDALALMFTESLIVTFLRSK